MADPAPPPRIAVIDDDKSTRDAIEGMMRALGYSPAAFASADQFLGWAGRSGVDCIVTDIQMPGRSGVELQRVLAAEGSLTPIIFVTALPPGDPARASAEAASANRLIPKPVDSAALIRALADAVAG